MHLNKKDFAICFSAAFVFFLPLMMAGVYYRDDLDRATTGYFGWSSLGRPFADLILVLFSSSSTHAVNLFPLSIVYTSVFIALAAYFLGCYLKRSGEVNYRLISAMIIFNPFYLQNAAYRYDSIGMSLAFALSVFSFCFFSKSIAVKYTVSVISLILALSTYQTCTNVFIALIGFEVLISLKSKTYTDVFKIVAREGANKQVISSQV
ncbi:TPA: glucosyltransferase domain-containing protein, partial [Enterobacter hormaechei subsp. xiangfangensis]|nr:glucosyltransferase domain-containing protein [Enterobacter hormaechei subsp. xiangfangensis]